MSDIKIVPVPVICLGDVWPMVSPWMLRGLCAASDIVLTDMVDGFFDGRNCLWTIFDGDKLVGTFATTVIRHDCGFALDVFALAGDGIEKWGSAISRAMNDHAKEVDCDKIVFCGRKGLLRAYDEVRIVGERQPGVYQFERTVQ